MSIGEDLTELNLAREKEEMYKLILENSADVIYIIDRDFKFVDISPSVYFYLGIKPEELIGKRFDEVNLVDPSYLEIVKRETLRVFKGEKIYFLVFPLISKDGKKKWAEISAVPIFKKGKIIGQLAIARDITKRVLAEMEVRESEERYFKLMENLNTGILITNEEGEILYYNFLQRKGMGNP